jgi:hypothetical protein
MFGTTENMMWIACNRDLFFEPVVSANAA